LPIESRLRSAAVHLQRAMLAHRVRPGENPVLPGAESAEDARLHAFPAREAEIRFHTGERIGREARALLDRDAHFIVPIEIVGREGDQAEFGSEFRVELLADALARRLDRFRLAGEMRADAR